MNELLWLALGALVAGFVQGISGFAFSMVSMSIWAWALEPALAAPMAVLGAFVGQLMGVFTVRRGFEWQRLWPFLLGGLAGIPLGVSVLPHLDVPWFKAWLGGMLVVFCPLMLLAARLPHWGGAGRWTDGLAGAIGGGMSALGGFSGVVPALWCTVRGMVKEQQRAVIQNFNLAALTVTLLVYFGSGLFTRQMAMPAAVVVAAVPLASILGARVYTGLSDLAFRRLVLGLLTVSGVVLLSAAVPALLARGF